MITWLPKKRFIFPFLSLLTVGLHHFKLVEEVAKIHLLTRNSGRENSAVVESARGFVKREESDQDETAHKGVAPNWKLIETLAQPLEFVHIPKTGEENSS